MGTDLGSPGLPSETLAATCSRSDLGGLSPPLGLTHNMNSALLGGGGVVQYSCDKTQNLYVRCETKMESLMFYHDDLAVLLRA